MRAILLTVMYALLLFTAVAILESTYVPGTLAPFNMAQHATLGHVYESLDRSALPHTTGMLVDVAASLGYTFGDALQWAGEVAASAGEHIEAALASVGVDLGPLKGVFTLLGNPIAEMLNAVVDALQGVESKP